MDPIEDQFLQSFYLFFLFLSLVIIGFPRSFCEKKFVEVYIFRKTRPKSRICRWGFPFRLNRGHLGFPEKISMNLTVTLHFPYKIIRNKVFKNHL